MACCYASYPASDTMKDTWLFSMDVIREALSSTGHDVSRLSAPFAGRPSALGNHQFALSLTSVLGPNLQNILRFIIGLS